ncbi:MAG: amidohydrolase family protein [Sphingobium sp.]
MAIPGMQDETFSEQPIEPDLPIIDSHHHLWFLPNETLSALESQNTIFATSMASVFRKYRRYLFDEFSSDVHCGHNIRATIFIDAHAMYRATGPETMRSVGEIEFVNGVAAMSASGLFGDVRLCASIVGGVDLRMGDAVPEILNAHMLAGGGRYRGVRGQAIVHDTDAHILSSKSSAGVMLDPAFRCGFKWLREFDLSFDVFLFEPQLPELLDLARAFPETRIILNHMGSPLGVGRFDGKLDERFPIWRDNIAMLSQCENVAVKLGGLGTPFAGLPSSRRRRWSTSSELASEWRPYIETCIEQFGPKRCMFESNSPVDKAVGSYGTIWNAFKIIASGASDSEKKQLFYLTAENLYKLNTDNIYTNSTRQSYTNSSETSLNS